MKKLPFLGLLLLIIVGLSFYLFKDTLFPVKAVHFHAGFKVYKNNKQVDFTDFKYMHESPCTINGKPVKGAHDSEQELKAHLHDFIGDVVHVHRTGATWNDLFTNLKYPIDESKTTEYLNGKKVTRLLETPIHPYDSVLFFIGSNPDEKTYVQLPVTKNHILDRERHSENCSGSS